MKLNQDMFSLFGTIRKSKAFKAIERAGFSVRNIIGTEALYSGNACHEKLQIIYANIRV